MTTEGLKRPQGGQITSKYFFTTECHRLIAMLSAMLHKSLNLVIYTNLFISHAVRVSPMITEV